MKFQIKQEPVSENEDDSTPSTSKATVIETSSEKTIVEKSAKSTKNAVEKTVANRALNTSGESLYEDAVSQSIKPQSSQQSNDATFVTTADDVEMETLSPRNTYIIPKNVVTSEPSNTTFNVENQTNSAKRMINDQTVLLKPNPDTKSKISGASIMTEDDSDSDTGIRKPTALKSKKHPKELFK